jgi:hypothetical protein
MGSRQIKKRGKIMKIEKLENETKKVNFKNLKVGDCYLDSNNRLCMKMDSISSDSYDCVCLEDGRMALIRAK